MKYIKLFALFLMLVFCISIKAQNKTDQTKDNVKSETKDAIPPPGPNAIARNIIQDRKGNIWIAAFDGIFRYDGKVFTNVTSKVSSARFFSVLEDSKGNLWFGSIGSGIYYYDGHSFQNFTIKDGLLNNDVGSIYEDKKGDIWFGVFGGASCYDARASRLLSGGKGGQAVFRNYIISEDAMNEDRTGKTFAERPPYEVNSIIEDKTGKLWFGTRGNTFVYDDEKFTIIRTKDGKPFTNVRTIIEDKKGNIWLSGNDGLWRYDGSSFTNFTKSFAGYIYEDKNGNIWTSSASADNKSWSLSRYDGKSLSSSLFINSPAINPTVTVIKSNEGMIFGILEAYDGSIWFGTLKGVTRYDGKTFNDFKGKGF
jgi:ligand-binding sensor domain-containing protein